MYFLRNLETCVYRVYLSCKPLWSNFGASTNEVGNKRPEGGKMHVSFDFNVDITTPNTREKLLEFTLLIDRVVSPSIR